MASPRRHTLVLSDVHLSTVLRSDGPWMRYRQRSHLLDDELTALLDEIVAAAHGESLEVVLNGDFFDFDAPDLDAMASGILPLSTSRTEPGAVATIQAILADHPSVLDAMGRVLRSGGSLVFVPGNHDSQLAFAGVRDVLVSRLVASTQSQESAESLGARISFRTWFHRTADGIHVEHGHQYDPLCAMGALIPSGPCGHGVLEDTIGSVVTCYASALLGCINPHLTDPLALGLDDYVAIVRCSTRFASPQWYVAAMAQMLRQLASIADRCSTTSNDVLIQSVCAESGVDLGCLAKHQVLCSPRASVDQFCGRGAWNGYGADTDRRLRSAMASIADVYSARGVVTGHTHQPYGSWNDGKFFGNTGSWTPRLGANVGVEGDGSGASGTFVWLVSNDRGICGGTYRKSNGAILPVGP